MSVLAAAVLYIAILISQPGLCLLSQAIDSHLLDCQKNTVITCLNWNNSFSDNSDIVFEGCASGGKVFHLKSQHAITIVNHSNLCISGGKASVIECTSSNKGITFTNIHNLRLENLVIRNCSMPSESSKSFAGGIQITSCTNVFIKNITVENSKGTGLTLTNTAGTVTIENSIFQNNGQELAGDHRQDKMYKRYSLQHDKLFEYEGGGLKILIEDNASIVQLEIKDCKFLNNSAHSGGGLLVEIRHRASGNTVSIQSSTFTDNNCSEGGGGGLQIGCTTEDESERNNITIQDCMFSRNDALYGGGTAIFANQHSIPFAQFTNCSWINNTAESDRGMAMTITIPPWNTFKRAGLFPSLMFTNSTFCLQGKSQNDTQRPSGSVLSVTKFRLEFAGRTVFEKNEVTAIEATSAELIFTAESETEFIENHGVYGGAMRLNELTVVYIQNSSKLLFKNNSADFGGAIYADIYEHSLVPSENCFLQWDTKNSQTGGNLIPIIIFEKNTAGIKCKNTACTDMSDCKYRGDAVYATTLEPCLRMCLSLTNVSEFVNWNVLLRCIGNFTFDKPSSDQFSTAGHHFSPAETKSKYDKMCPIFLNCTDDTIHINRGVCQEPNINQKIFHFIPGKITKLELKLVDELCGEIFFLLSVQVLEPKKSIFVNPAYEVITNNSIVLHGKPNESGKLQLATIDIRNMRTIQINVVMDDCPPGYVLHEENTCMCSASTTNTRYPGIEMCNETSFRAYLKHGYWMGYSNTSADTKYKGETLASTICPKGFCTKLFHWLWSDFNPDNTSKIYRALCPESFCDYTTDQPEPRLLLPKNRANLSNLICNPNREGRVCGTCKDNHSATYHSMSFSCKPDGLCDLGWLFYIVTELLPVTVLFLVVIFFNISFTSGPLNGVVFFMQVVDTMKLNAENFIQVDPNVLTFARVHKFAYRIFALNVLSLEEFSFCLWKGASALDMLAFRYVTIMYSLLLVVTTVFMIKMCDCRRRKLVLNLKGSIIHGLSAFVIMSYSECTRVSLMILTWGTLTEPEGPQMNHTRTLFAFYNGEYDYMQQKHLTYAVPAIFFTMTMVTIPPLLLLSYPLCYKLFALLKIEESKCVEITCKIFPLEKIKPMFDSIQGTFKDSYRFFAGLYFVYRLCALLTFTYTDRLSQYYIVTGVQLVCMLAIHSVCRPYKKTWHNVLDALLFSNLAIINILTIYKYHLSLYNIDEISTVQQLAGVQTALVLLPLVYLLIYITYHEVKRVKTACVRKSAAYSFEEIDNTNEVIDNLDTRDFDGSTIEMNDYRLLGPEPRVRK